MGFEDKDYESLIEGNFKKNITTNFFTTTKIIKMAGNSIVVPVLEEVFKQMLYVDEHFLSEAVEQQDNPRLQLVREPAFAGV